MDLCAWNSGEAAWTIFTDEALQPITGRYRIGAQRMDTSVYSIGQLAADLREICAQTKNEREVLSQVRPLALRAALAKDSWLKPHMVEADQEQGYSVHLH